MAPKVPIIEQDVQIRPVGSQGMLQKVSNPYIARTTALEDTAVSIMQKQQEQDDELKLLEAQKVMDDWGSQNLNSSESGAFNIKGKDAFGISKTYTEKFDKDMQSWAEQNLTTERQRLLFRRMWVGRRGSNLTQLDNHESREKNAYVDEQTKAASRSSQNRAIDNYQDPVVFNAALDGARAPTLLRAKKDGLLFYKEDGSVDMDKLPPSVKEELEIIDSNVYSGAFNRMVDEDPKAAVDFFEKNVSKFKGADLQQASKIAKSAERKYKARDTAQNVLRAFVPPRAQNDIIDNTIRLEGGFDKTVIDSNGEAVRAGINIKHVKNKDGTKMTAEQLKALTPEEIRDLYKEQYWDAGKIGDLPPQMQLVAFDAVVQHGADEETLAAIKDANGDPMKLIEWRIKKFERLRKADPDTWNPRWKGVMNRMKDLAIAVNQNQDELPDEFEMIRRIDETTDDIEVAKDAKQLVKESLAAMKAAKEVKEKEAADRVQDDINNGRTPKEADIAAMSAADQKAMRNAEPDAGLYWVLHRAVASGEEIDLTKFRWQLGGKYNELLDIQNDPEKQLYARKVSDVLKSGSGLIIGKANPSSPDDFKKLESFERKFNERMKAEAKATAGGKKPGAETAQRILDELLFEVKSYDPREEIYSRTRRMYEVKDDDEITYYPGVETGWEYTIGDKKRTYNEVVRLLRDGLLMKGLAPDEKNMKDAYDKLIEKKILKRFH